MLDAEKLRFGSGGFSDVPMIYQAGIDRPTPGGIFIGIGPHGQACYSPGQAGALLCGGARAGKGNFIIPWLVDGHYRDHIINMDWKGQNGPIAQLQVLQGRHVVNFCPRGGRNVAQHCINPVSPLRGDSSTLIPDTKMWTQSWITTSGVKGSEYFDGVAQRLTESITVTFARIKGEVNLPELADLIGGIGGTSEEWLGFEFEMSQSPDEYICHAAATIKEWRNSKESNVGGAAAIKNIILNAFSCLSDPQLRAAVSPPFDFCFSELTKPGTPPHMVNIMEAQEYATVSAPIIRALYTCALIYKRREIGSRPQLWVLDEIGNVGSWPMAVDLFSFGAGYGIRPIAIVQSTAQLAGLAPNADQIIPNSAGTQIYMGIRSLRQAVDVAQMLGKQTLEYDDFALQEEGRFEAFQAYNDALFGNGDPNVAGMQIAQHRRKAQHRSKQAREVRTHDEVMNEGNDSAYVFMPGVLERPMLAKIPRYWQRRDLAGRFLPDLFHSSSDKVEIATWLGQRPVPVITERVPRTYAKWPQYRQSGKWSYVKGFRP